jgi:hypothetical protein
MGYGRLILIYGGAMEQDKKTIEVTEEQKELLYAAMMHVGGGFEKRMAARLPVSYQYTKPGQVPTFQKKLMVDLVEYESVCNDLADVPTGVTKFTHWDRSRDFVQNKIIDKIKQDQGSNHTFLLYTRPRIEALGLTTFKLRVEGIWVKAKNVKQINAPEEFEEPFPYE